MFILLINKKIMPKYEKVSNLDISVSFILKIPTMNFKNVLKFIIIECVLFSS